jgi:hypothetical protein
MFGRRKVVPLLVLTAMVTAGQAQRKASLDDLSWLSGCWEGRQGNAILEEIWSKPAGGSMLGLGRTVKENRTASFEFMRFREENGSLVFLPQPQGNAPVPFSRNDSLGGTMTSENKEHDIPPRVIYERKGPRLLLAAVEGTYKGKEEREEFQMRKVNCNPRDE